MMIRKHKDANQAPMMYVSRTHFLENKRVPNDNLRQYDAEGLHKSLRAISLSWKGLIQVKFKISFVTINGNEME